MIDLTSKERIRNDLSSSTTSLEYLVEIGSGNETIFISTKKQMLDLYQSTYEEVGIYGQEMLPNHPYGWYWITLTNLGDIIVESWSQTITFGSNHTIVHDLPSGQEWVAGAKYNCSVDVVDMGDNPENNPPMFFCSLVRESAPGVGAWYIDGVALSLGLNTFQVTIRSDLHDLPFPFHLSHDGFAMRRMQNVIIGAISVKQVVSEHSEPTYVSPARYYEDLNLRVSNIGEKIDLKTKKIQLSSMNVTLTNLLVDGVRLSDRLLSPIGDNINIYIKSQSCKTLEDCIKIANLKITRYDHDDKNVKINADDVSLETFYIDLPIAKYKLKKDVNTFEHYDDKMIPMLYGHLKTAPAVVYYEENSNYIDENGIKLLCDSAYMDSSVNIEGIKPYNRLDAYGNYKGTDLMINPDMVSFKLGSFIHNVQCHSFENSAAHIKSVHHYPQWDSSIDHVTIYTIFPSGFRPTASINQALWCHSLAKPTNQEALTYTYTQYGNFYEPGEENGEWMYGVKSQHNAANVGYTAAYSVGVQSFDFENNVADVDLMDSEEDITLAEAIYGQKISPDIHFIGNIKLTQIKVGDYSVTGDNLLRFFSTYTSYVHNPSVTDYQDSVGNNEAGENGFWSPSGYQVTDFGMADPNWYAASRNAFKVEGISGDNNQHIQYENYFRGAFYDADQLYEGWTSLYDASSTADDYSSIDASKLVLYYIKYNISLTETLDIKAEWENVQIRKTWLNKEMWSKDFFVNARGRTGADDTGVQTINGEIRVYHEGTDTSIVPNRDENRHLLELYKYLTDEELQIKNIDGKVYQIMLVNKDSNNYRWIYDIDITGMHGYEDMPLEHELNNPIINNVPIGHTTGWVLNLKGKTFVYGGISQLETYFLNGFDLIYGKKIYNNNQVVINIESIPSPELNAFNDSNLYVPDPPDAPYGNKGYSYVICNPEDITPAKKLIETPSGIIKHLIENEMSASNAQLDSDKYSKAYISDQDNRFAFSITEAENSKDIIEKICEQSRLMFRYRPRDKRAVLDTIKDTYTDLDVDYTVNTKNLLSYSYTKSKIEDLCIGGCRVKYKYDYGKGELSKTTDDINLYAWDILGAELIPSGDPANNSFTEDTGEWTNGHFFYEYEGSLIIVDEFVSIANPLELGKKYQVEIDVSAEKTIEDSYWLPDIPNLAFYFHNPSTDEGGIIELSSGMNTFVIGDEDNPIEEIYETIGFWRGWGHLINSMSIKEINPEVPIVSTTSLDLYKDYYGIADEKNYEVEIEAPYIQDKPTAERLRDFIFRERVNQHLIIKFSMSIKEGIELEVGDIVRFDDNPRGIKPYGIDITTTQVPLNQMIYPYFLITNVNKNLKKVSLECYQLHNLSSFEEFENFDPIGGKIIRPTPMPAEGDIR